MNRKRYAGQFNRLRAAGATAALLGMLAVPASAFAEQTNTPEQYKEARALIAEHHIGGRNVPESATGSIDDMLEALKDPYTDYFTEEEWNGFMNSLDLNYAGIGMRLGQDEGGFVAVEIFEGSPAAAAGMKRNDYIVSVAGKTTDGLTLDQVTELVRGPEGSDVAIRVRRAGQDIDLTVKRGQIHMPVVSGGMMEGGVGYLDINSFSEDADELFASMLSELKSRSIRGLVVDLRDNPGGILDTAKHIAEQFIPQGVLIHTRDRDDVDEPLVIEKGHSVEFPVVVLVNENSASASEVLTAALQDYHKAIAVGVKTYGKGSVQGLYPLESGGVLKVTIQEYLSPDKRKVNHVGLEPDVATEGTVPQLLTGLHKAGLREFRLEAFKHSYTVNGFEFFDARVPVLQADGATYVPARVLAALVGQPLQWNEAAYGVDIGAGAGKLTFDASSGFRIEGGTGVIDLNRFKARFPQIDWTSDSEKTVLTAKGNGV